MTRQDLDSSFGFLLHDIARLMRKRFDRRAHHSDRRVRQLYLTAKAEPVFARMRALADETRAEALAGLSPDERERLTATLVGIRSNLSDRTPPGNGTTPMAEKPTGKPAAKKHASGKTVSNKSLGGHSGN